MFALLYERDRCGNIDSRRSLEEDFQGTVQTHIDLVFRHEQASLSKESEFWKRKDSSKVLRPLTTLWLFVLISKI